VGHGAIHVDFRIGGDLDVDGVLIESPVRAASPGGTQRLICNDERDFRPAR
jgi:hypothetical protein